MTKIIKEQKNNELKKIVNLQCELTSENQISSVEENINRIDYVFRKYGDVRSNWHWINKENEKVGYKKYIQIGSTSYKHTTIMVLK